MGNYGRVAIDAVALLMSGDVKDLRAAWKQAAVRVFPTQLASRKKACPMDAFLGLCDEGLVKGVNPGRYTRSRKNKQYAIDALKKLRANPALAAHEQRLWNLILQGKHKTYNQQMDVVISLWQNRLIK
ncbi:MAG: DUF6979 family protein [Candidatus Hodarchaeota archaeon]